MTDVLVCKSCKKEFPKTEAYRKDCDHLTDDEQTLVITSICCGKSLTAEENTAVTEVFKKIHLTPTEKKD